MKKKHNTGDNTSILGNFTHVLGFVFVKIAKDVALQWLIKIILFHYYYLYFPNSPPAFVICLSHCLSCYSIPLFSSSFSSFLLTVYLPIPFICFFFFFFFFLSYYSIYFFFLFLLSFLLFILLFHLTYSSFFLFTFIRFSVSSTNHIHFYLLSFIFSHFFSICKIIFIFSHKIHPSKFNFHFYLSHFSSISQLYRISCSSFHHSRFL